MKKFKISVNGKSYEVEVEELDQGAAKQNISNVEPVAQSTPVESKPAPQVEEAGDEAVPQDAQVLKAPMPGTILDIKVNRGDKVTEGQVVVILEAMKMENEIVSPATGTIVAINTSKGTSVNTGDPLLSIE